MGTVAIAAQAMTNILENLNGVAAIGIGIGLMTVVGECMGAGRKDEAVYYVKKLSGIAEVIIIICCGAIFPAHKAHHDAVRHGAGECEPLLPYDYLDHDRETHCLDRSLYSGLWPSGSR